MKAGLIIIFLGWFLWVVVGTSMGIEKNALKKEDFNRPLIMSPANYYIVTAPTFSTKAEVVGMIAQKSYEAGINPISALKIAFCESRYDPLAENNSSTAKGLFQVLDGTWKHCEGDPFNPDDNINCFIKLYPQHPSWWKCKG